MDFVLKAFDFCWRSCLKFQFQSLFYWILFLRLINRHVFFSSLLLFQSLFYWILFLRIKENILGGMKDGVSILVLLDFVLKVLEFKADADAALEFQSLFYWILFLRFSSSSCTRIEANSFNPCFIGFCS